MQEWGNPEQPEYYDYIKSYSPVDNIRPIKYPHLLVTAGRALCKCPAMYILNGVEEGFLSSALSVQMHACSGA